MLHLKRRCTSNSRFWQPFFEFCISAKMLSRHRIWNQHLKITKNSWKTYISQSYVMWLVTWTSVVFSRLPMEMVWVLLYPSRRNGQVVKLVNHTGRKVQETDYALERKVTLYRKKVLVLFSYIKPNYLLTPQREKQDEIVWFLLRKISSWRQNQPP